MAVTASDLTVATALRGGFQRPASAVHRQPAVGEENASRAAEAL